MTTCFKLPAGVCLAGMALAAPAHATSTFAQFVQSFPHARIFTYSNVNSASLKAKLGTIGGSNIVLVSHLGSLASPTSAVVNLTATAAALPSASANIAQRFSGSITFTLLAPQIGLSGPSLNALKVTFDDAILLAAPGASAPTLQSDGLSTISYASDFADITGLTPEDFSLSFSGASSPLSMAGARLPNFYISGSGTFAVASALPEPANWSLMLVGFGLAGATLRRVRKQSVAFA